jgi:hypothetical protein
MVSELQDPAEVPDGIDGILGQQAVQEGLPVREDGLKSLHQNDVRARGIVACPLVVRGVDDQSRPSSDSANWPPAGCH